MKNSEIRRRALIAAFPHTAPILAGFLFLGTAYGIYARVSGLSAAYPILMSIFIFAGSLEFLMVGLLRAPFDPMGALFLTFMVNARHLFYGISMLDKYRGTGLKKLYLIFGMCDESFSINLTADIPIGVDKGWFMFFVTLLNHSYWICGAAIGGIFGSAIAFNTAGLEFVMTALFVVIFLEQWRKDKKHHCAVLGIGISLLCLVLFGGDSFLFPTLLIIFSALSLLKKPLEKAGAVE